MPDRASVDSASGANANIARHLVLMARAQPDAAAVKIPRGRTDLGEIDYLTLSFVELESEVAAWAQRLLLAGVRRGDRTLVMVRQGLPLIAAVFALFRVGAVPIVIDPGMGRKQFLGCVARSRPRALVGIPRARLVSHFFRRAFATVAVRVPASGAATARLTSGSRDNSARVPTAVCEPTELAAILFTSGSTGAPKGVCYEHGMFEAQVRSIRETYRIEPGEIDLPLLPLFALFNPALGMTTIVPEIDPRRPAAFDPGRIVQAIRQENVTNSFGSPALWGKIAAHCRAHQVVLPSLRRVLCAGAAVPAQLWNGLDGILARGKLHSPYGATEALPVSTIAAGESDPASTRGACVGRPVAGVDVRIIEVTDTPITWIGLVRELRDGEIGEIIVRGSVVTKLYDALPEATRQAKISDAPPADESAIASPSEAAVWHRMGDCGYRDADGRLWFCGRKAERVETLDGTMHTEPCEQVFRSHPRAGRCALIGLGATGQQRPAIVVETRISDQADARSLAAELRALARAHPHTAAITLFFFRETFPVDVRHNAKIHRLTLTEWASREKGFESAS